MHMYILSSLNRFTVRTVASGDVGAFGNDSMGYP